MGMQAAGSVAILAGISLAYLAEIIGAIFVFRQGILEGVLSLLIPGYFLFALRRQRLYGSVVGTWLAGILGLVVGTMILS